MKRLLIICCALTLLLSMAFRLGAQVDSKLTRASEKIESYLKEKKPDWARHEIQPISGSENVVIAQWVFNDRTVNVSIIGHKANKDAMEEIQRLAADAKVKVKRKQLGDEGYAWNARGAIAFRKGNLTIYVNANASDLAEEEALSEEFAGYVAEAINAPL